MPTEPQPLQNFNTDTMSGIYPGSRNMVYQRLRLHHGDSQDQWYQLQEQSEANIALLLPIQADQPSSTPAFSIAGPQQPDFTNRLHDGLTEAGMQADACYICRLWQPMPVQT